MPTCTHGFFIHGCDFFRITSLVLPLARTRDAQNFSHSSNLYISPDLRLIEEKIGMLTMHRFHFVINLLIQIYVKSQYFSK